MSKELLVNIRPKAEKLSFSTTPTKVVTVDEGAKAVISCDVSGNCF